MIMVWLQVDCDLKIATLPAKKESLHVSPELPPELGPTRPSCRDRGSCSLGRLQGSWKAAFSLVIHRGRPISCLCLALAQTTYLTQQLPRPPSSHAARTPSASIFCASATPRNHPTASAVLFKTRFHS